MRLRDYYKIRNYEKRFNPFDTGNDTSNCWSHTKD